MVLFDLQVKYLGHFSLITIDIIEYRTDFKSLQGWFKPHSNLYLQNIQTLQAPSNMFKG